MKNSKIIDNHSSNNRGEEGTGKIVNEIIDNLNEGTFPNSQLVESGLSNGTPEEIQDGWDFLISIGGQFNEIQSVNRSGPDSISAIISLENSTVDLKIHTTDSDTRITSIELSQQATVFDQAKLLYGILKDRIFSCLRNLKNTTELTTPQDHVERSRELLEACRKGDFHAVYSCFSPEERSQIDVDHVEQSWNRYINDVHAILNSEFDAESGMTKITFQSDAGTFVWETEFTQSGELGHWFIRQGGAQESDYSAPEFENKDTYIEHSFSISVNNKTADGRLTVPKDVENAPLVVLTQGSGPHDFDETMGGTKLLRDLAVGLANHGIITVRTDKLVPEDPASYSIESVYLPLVDTSLNKVYDQIEITVSAQYLLGHSLGGHLVGKVASASNRSFDGLIALCPPARRMDTVVADQVEYVRRYTDSLTEEGRRDIEAARNIPETVKNSSDDEMVFELPASFWRILLDHSPIASLEEKRSLILCGTRDWRLSDQDFKQWSRSAAENDVIQYHEYTNLDHLLMRSESAENPSPGREAVNLEQSVVSDIAEWIQHDSTCGFPFEPSQYG